MSKLLERDGKFFRMRRGKLVEIPSKWVGHTTNSQTIQKRRSKQTRAARQMQSHPTKSGFTKKSYRALHLHGNEKSRL